MLVHFGMLEKFARFHARPKVILGKKAVILALNLTGARRTGCAGNRINEIGSLAERIAQRRFPGAGWRGKDKQNSVTREFVTQGFALVREFSPARSCTLPPAEKCPRHSLSPLVY
jgi:hypothetical protein